MRWKPWYFSAGYLFLILNQTLGLVVYNQMPEVYLLLPELTVTSPTPFSLVVSDTRNTSSRPSFKHRGFVKIDLLNYGNTFISVVNRLIMSQYQMRCGQNMYFLFPSQLYCDSAICYRFSSQMHSLFSNKVTILISQCCIKIFVELSTILKCFFGYLCS